MLVEFSLVFVIFAFICYALVAFGMAVNLKQNLTSAAAEGARSAVGNPACDLNDADAAAAAQCKVDKEQAAIDHFTADIGGQSENIRNAATDNVTATIARCSGATGPWCITVALAYPYDEHPIVPSAPGLGVVMPETLSVRSVVQVSN